MNQGTRNVKFVATLALVAVCLLAVGCETNDAQSQNTDDEQMRQARIEAVERLYKNSDSIKAEIKMFLGRYKEIRNVGRIVLSPTDAMILGQTQPGKKLGVKSQEEIIALVVQKYSEVGIDLNPLRVAITFIPYRVDDQ